MTQALVGERMLRKLSEITFGMIKHLGNIAYNYNKLKSTIEQAFARNVYVIAVCFPAKFKFSVHSLGTIWSDA